MKSLSALRFSLVGSIALAALAAAGALGACVGDDPTVTSPVDGDSGGETGTTTTDSGGGDTGMPGTDSSTGDAADAGPWTPAKLDEASNLAVWLEPSAANFIISNGTIGTWKDLSKNKNDAKNAATGPTIHAGAINGHDAVRFASSNLLLTTDDAPSLQLASHQFYIVAVARLLPLGGAGYVFSKVSTKLAGGTPDYDTGFEFFAHQGTTDAGVNGNFPGAHVNSLANNELLWDDSVFDDSKFHIVASRRITPFRLALSVDDQPARETTTGSFDVSEVGKPVVFGSLKYGTFTPPVDFDIAELVIIHGSSAIVADEDVAQLHKYLKKKYAL